MKKLLLSSTILLTLSALSSFGQGYFSFGYNGARGIWDGFTSDHMRLAATMKVAFLWGPTNSTPLVDSIAVSTTTNYPTEIPPNAWNLILNDPNFQLAFDANTLALASVTNAANGAFNYLSMGQLSFVPVVGTAARTSYNIFVIGWDKAYDTPQLAAIAGAAVGWSNPFAYTTVDQIGTADTFRSAGLLPFGVSVPEPSTLSLLGFGSSTMLVFRRRNRNV